MGTRHGVRQAHLYGRSRPSRCSPCFLPSRPRKGGALFQLGRTAQPGISLCAAFGPRRPSTPHRRPRPLGMPRHWEAIRPGRRHRHARRGPRSLQARVRIGRAPLCDWRPRCPRGRHSGRAGPGARSSGRHACLLPGGERPRGFVQLRPSRGAPPCPAWHVPDHPGIASRRATCARQR